nr:OB-fold domain-containing protein [uncultured Brevundimonas sp.]
MTEMPLLAHPSMRAGPNGDLWLEGSLCRACQTVVVERTRACPACGARSLEPFVLSARGRLRTFTVVHRSFPGVATPFVSAIVDLEGGGVLKGVLKTARTDPEAIPFDLPIAVVLGDTGQSDRSGRAFLGYHFEPLEKAA